MSQEEVVLIPCFIRWFWYLLSIQVSRLGFGCAGLFGVYDNPVSEDLAISIIKHAFNKGITFFDTSDFYGSYAEVLIGKVYCCIVSSPVFSREGEMVTMRAWVTQKGLLLMLQALKELPREKIQLATKFGLVRAEATRMIVNGTPAYVRSSCEATLKQLNVAFIDLYYQHRVDTSVPIEETVSINIFFFQNNS